MNKPNLFISYCWDNKTEVELLDKSIQMFFPEITIIRDKKNLKNGMNIKEYMRSIRQVDYAAIIITDKFLKSKNCMYEITELIEENRYSGKIIPISVNDFGFFDENIRTIYYDFWKDEMIKAQKLYDKYHNQDYKTHVLLCTKTWYYLDDFFNYVKDIKFFNLEGLKMWGDDEENDKMLIKFFQGFADYFALNIDLEERHKIFLESFEWAFFCFNKNK